GIPGRDGDRRVPALPLAGQALTGLVGAATGLLEERFGEDLVEQLSALVTDRAAARLTDELVAMPDLVAAMVLDLRARALVAQRRLRARALERYGRPVMEWRAPEKDAPPMLDALVERPARAAFAPPLPTGAPPPADRPAVRLGPAGAGEPRDHPRAQR